MYFVYFCAILDGIEEKMSMENLIGDNIMSKRPKKEKGVEKTIYFANISCPNFEQFTIDGSSRKASLSSIIKESFNINNNNYDSKNQFFSFVFEGKSYAFKILEDDANSLFGQLSTEKEYNDILEEYKSDDNKTLKYLIIKSFTFFYIDKNKKALVYIGHKNLKNTIKIFVKYFEKYSNENVIIKFYGDNNLIEKINKSQKLKSIDFQIADTGEISKTIDQTLSWDRNINNFIINIKIKHPTKPYVKQMLSDKNKYQKIAKPVIKFQDETFNDYVSHLFEEYFTIKETIYISQIDINGFSKIKDTLINATTKFMG